MQKARMTLLVAIAIATVHAALGSPPVDAVGIVAFARINSDYSVTISTVLAKDQGGATYELSLQPADGKAYVLASWRSSRMNGPSDAADRFLGSFLSKSGRIYLAYTADYRVWIAVVYRDERSGSWSMYAEEVVYEQQIVARTTVWKAFQVTFIEPAEANGSVKAELFSLHQLRNQNEVAKIIFEYDPTLEPPRQRWRPERRFDNLMYVDKCRSVSTPTGK